MEALTYVVSVSLRGLSCLRYSKIAQGDWNRRNLEPPSELHIYIYIWSEIFRSPDRAKSEAKYGGHGGSSELYKDWNDTSIRLAVWLGEAKLIWPLGAAMYGKNTRVLWCFIVKEDWGWPACQPPQRLQNSACRYRSSLFRVHWEALSYVGFSPPAQFLLYA